MLTSVITHPALSALVIIRASYVGICEKAPDAACAAGLLAVFEYWLNKKISNRIDHAARNAALMQQNPSAAVQGLLDTELWVERSMQQLIKDCMGLWREDKIRANRDWLEQQGFLTSRNDPNHTWKRTLQYMLVVPKVQEAIDAWAKHSGYLGESIPEFSGMDIAKYLESIGDKTALESPENQESIKRFEMSLLWRLLTEKNSATPASGGGQAASGQGKKGKAKKADKSPDEAAHKRANVYLGIYWQRVQKVYETPPISLDKFREKRYAQALLIGQHVLEITGAEFAKYLDDISAQEFYAKERASNGTAKLPSLETLGKEIHLAVAKMREGTYNQVKQNTPSTPKAGDYPKSRFGSNTED